jgi:hypothetical protein
VLHIYIYIYIYIYDISSLRVKKIFPENLFLMKYDKNNDTLQEDIYKFVLISC